MNGDDAIFMETMRCVHGLSCFKMVVKAACADASRSALIGAEQPFVFTAGHKWTA